MVMTSLQKALKVLIQKLPESAHLAPMAMALAHLLVRVLVHHGCLALLMRDLLWKTPIEH
jgi:hypothetical protein